MDTPSSKLTVWLKAFRPATLSASIGPVVVGGAMAHADGAFALDRALVALAAALLIQIGTNLYNDAADFDRGADTAERLGPARAVQRGWLSSTTVKRAALGSFALAATLGLYLVIVAGPWLLAIGLASIVAGIAYTAGPAPLAYRGLGDVFVLLFFGVVAVCGSYFIHTGRVTTAVLLASIAVGALATAILAVNNLRDREGDARAGKRTLVVRFGASFGRAEHAVLVVLAYLAALAMWWLTPHNKLPLALLTLPLAVQAVWAVARKDGAALNDELGRTARLGLLFNLALTIGVLA